MSLLLLIVLLLIVFGGLPTWGYHEYGYAPSGLGGIVLLIVVILVLTGRLQFLIRLHSDTRTPGGVDLRRMRHGSCWSFVVYLFVAATLLVAAQAPAVEATKQPVQHSKKRVHKPPRARQVGKASWYGRAQSGKKTASGERFDPNKMTAAHPTLPLGSTAVVTNLDTGKSAKVTVNDRGPHVKGRQIDLSRAAAQKIGMTSKGVTTVKIEATPSPGGAAHNTGGADHSTNLRWRRPAQAYTLPTRNAL